MVARYIFLCLLGAQSATSLVNIDSTDDSITFSSTKTGKQLWDASSESFVFDAKITAPDYLLSDGSSLEARMTALELQVKKHHPSEAVSWAKVDGPQAEQAWKKSGSNYRTASFDGYGGGVGTILATGGKSSGKWYAEILVDSHDQHSMVGVWKSGGQYTMIYHDNQLCCVVSPYPAYGPSSWLDSGNVIGIAIDLDAGDLEFFLNGVGHGSVKTKQPGLDYSSGTWHLSAQDGTSGANSMSVTILDRPRHAVPASYQFWTFDSPPFYAGSLSWIPLANWVVEDTKASVVDTVSGGVGTILATGGKSSGKWYTEVLIGAHDNNFMVGVWESGGQYTMIYHDNLLCCVVSPYPAYDNANWLTAGNVIGIAIDLDAGDLEFFLNGVGHGSVKTKQPGLDYSSGTWHVSAADGSSATNQLTVTILNQPRYSVPQGYQMWSA